ncbi:MAG: hypothetical protein QN194_14930 [Armatimonadota bacterium]|nr:hypothetical protein [Armatimonadota bacterium]
MKELCNDRRARYVGSTIGMGVALVVVALGALVGCTPVPRTGGRPTTTVIATQTSTATSTATATTTATATVVPTPFVTQASSLSRAGRPAEVVVIPLSTVEEAVAGGVLEDLPVPDGLSVSTSGCARDGACYWYNFYWAATREVVLHGNDTGRLAHEMCHAHQHWTINGGADLAPSDYDLEQWYATAEAASYSRVATDWPWPYQISVRANLLEDFAEACGLWYSDPVMLRRISPARYGWMAANLP